MERRERVETLIKLLKAIQLYLDESQKLLHGAMGEMDAAQDWARLERGRFELIIGGKSDGEDKE